MSETRVAIMVAAFTPVVCEPPGVAVVIRVAWPGLPPTVQTP
jgi:hypothetical protein